MGCSGSCGSWIGWTCTWGAGEQGSRGALTKVASLLLSAIPNPRTMGTRRSGYGLSMARRRRWRGDGGAQRVRPPIDAMAHRFGDGRIGALAHRFEDGRIGALAHRFEDGRIID